MRRLFYLPFACLAALPACRGVTTPTPNAPLTWGDAEWPEPPIPQPASDFGAVAECDPFAQDCPEGEKCVAYASTLTLEPTKDTLAGPIGALVKQDATALHKADAVVGFAKGTPTSMRKNLSFFR